MPLPKDPAKHDAYRAKIRAGRARQEPPFAKGSKFSAEHRANIAAGAKNSLAHKSKDQNGDKNPKFKGGFFDKNGYRVLRRNGREVMEHREVMMTVLGRALFAHETVHHKNGNRADNRPENLELWSSRQPKGQRVVDKLEYAREIIRLYGDAHENSSMYDYVGALLTGAAPDFLTQ